MLINMHFFVIEQSACNLFVGDTIEVMLSTSRHDIVEKLQL